LENIEYFASLVELLNLDVDRDAYINVAKQLEKMKDRDVFIYHRYSFIFEAFLDLLLWKIEIEDFMKVWDILSDRIIFDENSIDSEKFLKSIIDGNLLKDDAIYLVDKLSYIHSWIDRVDNLIYC